VGTGIVSTDERLAFQLARSYAQISQANSISVPALDKIDGHPVVSGTPTEVLGAIRGIKIARQALAHAGRPGLPIGNCISTAGTSMATVAASAPQFGLRPSDGWLIGALAEMKFNMGALSKLTYLSSWGANIGNESGPLVGGYAGGPAGVAVLNVAYRIIGRVMLNCDYHLTFPIHITKNCSTTRDTIWCAAVSGQAISRNTKELMWSLGYMAAGPMTKQFFYESAAYLAAVISSGVSAQTTHPARAILNDYVTPMEMRGSVEINQACVGMTRVQANELVKELLSKYEDQLANAPSGKRFQDCYNVETAQPLPEYVGLYADVKEELRNMGFNL
jgi:methylamine--corrinoid protein Co-methyltransferase